MPWPGVIEAYRALLPVTPATPVVTLLEGGTPLVPSARLGPRLGLRLSFKVDAANPTGSFKDRGMTVAVSRALEAGSRGVMCASTGNTAASAAAYAARAGLPAVIVLPAGGAAAGKLAQVRAHGARVLEVQGTFDAALAVTREAAARVGLTLVNSVNPDRLEGQKTAAFELCDDLGTAPDLVAIPVGNAGNITACWRGFQVYHRAGRIRHLPRLLGVQAAGAAPLVNGAPVARPRTVASAIRIGRPVSGAEAAAAVRESGGAFVKVSDAAILAAQRDLAEEEGLLVEPAAAAALAGVAAWAGRESFRGETVVCVLTGHGLKDPASLARPAAGPVSAAADVGAVVRAVERLLAGSL